MLVKVFQIDVFDVVIAECITQDILFIYPGLRVDFFDLEDRDPILRLEGDFFDIAKIVNCFSWYGYNCIYIPVE